MAEPFNADHVAALVSVLEADSGLVAEVTSERAKLAREIMLNPEAGKEIFSGGGNRTNFSAQITLTKLDRLNLLNRALKQVTTGATAGARSFARFV